MQGKSPSKPGRLPWEMRWDCSRGPLSYFSEENLLGLQKSGSIDYEEEKKQRIFYLYKTRQLAKPCHSQEGLPHTHSSNHLSQVVLFFFLKL